MSDAAVYAVRLCKGHGEWVWVLVDDFLPSSLMSGALYFCNSKERNEFWPSLVEKAMAKLAGSFQCLEGGMVSMGFTGFSGTSHALGGGTEFSVRPELGSPALNAEAMWKVIETAGAEGWAMETSPYGIFDLKDRMGLVAAHAYTVLDGALVGEHRLVRCRNTWGAREWKGAWSDKSKKWDEYPEYAHLRDEKEDGIFFIPLFSENKKDFLRLHKSFSLVIPEHDEQEGNTFVAELREAYGDKWGTDSRDRNFTPHFDSPWIDQKFSFSQWMEESCRFFLGGNPFGGELELSIPQMTRNDPPTKHNCSCLHNNWQLGIEVKGTEPVTFAVSSPFKICFSPTSKTEDGSAARRRFVYDDNIEDDAAWPRYSTSSDVTLKPGTWLVHVSATKAELSKFLGDAGAVVKLKPGAPLTILGEAPAASGYVEAVTQYEAGTENAQPSQWRLTVSEETEATFSADIEQLGGGDEDGWDMFEYWMWIRFNVSEKKEYNWEEYDWEPGWIGEGFGEEANLLKESEGGMYHFEAGVFISHMDYFQGSWLGKLPKGTHVMGLVGTDVCPGKCRITAVVTSTEGKNDCITCEKL
uniref:Calpain catalytic domain-containing protein n=1 Tax=Chromera velia CCMP2878 TaxID=1169474 RepID=A0A0G4GA83_9ALVE|eukprot:Cvel_4411.t1-p1 / transcript=Cvel_4411.t1 / gene=Cvel_4411 / organism=Chromera_velia_CCMP2878 / gene_product=Calpain-1 catalytic subunit, putative / transcript_product=Calpain-1 catalytic subunit, putative / location=Cvel_scaffold192:4024-8317(+) / protein_length=581 / sequence_SO=supercontig / SO=protein_coding / is_pseudo=false